MILQFYNEKTMEQLRGYFLIQSIQYCIFIAREAFSCLCSPFLSRYLCQISALKHRTWSDGESQMGVKLSRG